MKIIKVFCGLRGHEYNLVERRDLVTSYHFAKSTDEKARASISFICPKCSCHTHVEFAINLNKAKEARDILDIYKVGKRIFEQPEH